ncbi:AMP-binding protein [Streptomyces europaeiscabiei]|uniref:AMP-binding protein n=1 Tax=Streptomyces europaeiscabiei TaxID=146819 RepID=UPI0038F67E45
MTRSHCPVPTRPNPPHFTSVHFGIPKAGAAVVPLNALMKARQIAYHLTDSDAKAYSAFEGTAELPIGQTAWVGFRATEGCTGCCRTGR